MDCSGGLVGWELIRLPAHYRQVKLWKRIQLAFGETEYAHQRFTAGYDFKLVIERALIGPDPERAIAFVAYALLGVVVRRLGPLFALRVWVVGN